jgi:hypothetical protein
MTLHSNQLVNHQTVHLSKMAVLLQAAKPIHLVLIVALQQTKANLIQVLKQIVQLMLPKAHHLVITLNNKIKHHLMVLAHLIRRQIHPLQILVQETQVIQVVLLIHQLTQTNHNHQQTRQAQTLTNKVHNQMLLQHNQIQIKSTVLPIQQHLINNPVVVLTHL